MKYPLALSGFALVLLGSSTVLAAERTITLAVENMTCATCPPTVKKALSAVPGVSKVEVSLEKQNAVVTFDDARTTIEALTKASTNAGYPAKLAAAAKGS